MEEVYFKDQSYRCKLLGLEIPDDNMRERIECNAEKEMDMKSSAR